MGRHPGRRCWPARPGTSTNRLWCRLHGATPDRIAGGIRTFFEEAELRRTGFVLLWKVAHERRIEVIPFPTVGNTHQADSRSRPAGWPACSEQPRPHRSCRSPPGSWARCRTRAHRRTKTVPPPIWDTPSHPPDQPDLKRSSCPRLCLYTEIKESALTRRIRPLRSKASHSAPLRLTKRPNLPSVSAERLLVNSQWSWQCETH